MSHKKVILIIMDGWGLGKVASADAIQSANVPFTKSLYTKYPNTTLITCGEAVGLPDGQMGNSEVGHLNLGAGRVVYQELQRINAVSYTHLRAHETVLDLVCRLLLEKNNQNSSRQLPVRTITLVLTQSSMTQISQRDNMIPSND